MNVQKLIARQRSDSIHHGPSLQVTLGFIVDGRSIILGSFYEGPGMDDTSAGIGDRVWLEMFIDRAIASIDSCELSKTPKKSN